MLIPPSLFRQIFTPSDFIGSTFTSPSGELRLPQSRQGWLVGRRGAAGNGHGPGQRARPAVGTGTGPQDNGRPAPGVVEAGCSSACLSVPQSSPLLRTRVLGNRLILLEKPGLGSGHPCASPQSAHTSLLFSCRMHTEGE